MKPIIITALPELPNLIIVEPTKQVRYDGNKVKPKKHGNFTFKSKHRNNQT